MSHTSDRLFGRAHSAGQNTMLTRLYVGVLGLFPIVTAAVMTVVQSLPIAIVIAGLGAVTFMSMLPRGAGRRS